MAQLTDDRVDMLTQREREIASAYADGDTYHRIAQHLGLAPSTVRTHIATIYRKLGVSSKIDLGRVLSQRIAGLGAPDPLLGDAANSDSSAIVAELALSLEEAIHRERAMAEVLRIISRSSGNVSGVIAAVLGHALELCDAEFGILFEYDPDTGFCAQYAQGIPEAFDRWLNQQGTFKVGSGTGLGRMAASGEIINIADVCSEPLYRRGDPLREATADLGHARSFTAIPMLAGDKIIGAFTIYRQQVRPFDTRALEIARVFADQSVIAIENARLISLARKSV